MIHETAVGSVAFSPETLRLRSLAGAFFRFTKAAAFVSAGRHRGMGTACFPLLWEHEHFAVIDLMFRKNIRTGFRVYLNFRVREAHLHGSDSLDFIGNGDKK